MYELNEALQVDQQQYIMQIFRKLLTFMWMF